MPILTNGQTIHGNGQYMKKKYPLRYRDMMVGEKNRVQGNRVNGKTNYFVTCKLGKKC